VAAGALGPREFTDVSHRVFTSPRRVRFCEMEYAVPRAAGMEVLGELVRAVERSDWRISFPVEVRVAAADDEPLSTAFGRDTVYLAIHTHPGSRDRQEYFATLERIAGEVGGRPHWGKLHGLDAVTLRERYPRFEEFVALRDRLDPGRTFGNAHLASILGG
jgi:L-gulonolactone oxidase